MQTIYPLFRKQFLMLILFSALLSTSWAQEYRTIDGKGNNPYFKHYGSTGSTITREWFSPSELKLIHTPASYEDGISEPRGGRYARLLPGPREISNIVFDQKSLYANAKKYSSYIWLWGQFIDHDIDLFDDRIDPEEPFPILIPNNDPFFNLCPGEDFDMTFLRSDYHPETGTSRKNPRQQINSITAFIDASNVYGSSKDVQDSLRSFSDGKMKTSAGNLLPKAIVGPGEEDFFYAAGDLRANEHIGLTAMHTLFVREHNRLAEYIASHYSSELPSDPVARDEKIYQMARAIVGAQIQIITYKEFLPRILGSGAPSTQQNYNKLVNPGMSAVFSSAAFRFGHSLLPPVLYRRGADNQPISEGDIRLREAFFAPIELQKTDIDPLLRGFAIQYAQEFDNQVINDVRNLLFGNQDMFSEPNLRSFDLPARNIQRGRDHGVPSYVNARKAFGLGKPHNFEDITGDTTVIKQLKEAYSDIYEIDLWVGGLCEPQYQDAFVGITNFHIIKDQFVRLRDGDRFWYNAIDWVSLGFKEAVPIICDAGKELYDVRLADIIEWNTSIKNIAPWDGTDPLLLYAEKSPESIRGENDGTITLYVQGDYPPYTIEWENGSSDYYLEDLSPGAYNVWVTDSKGNKATYTVIINEGCPEHLCYPIAHAKQEELSQQRVMEQNYPNPFHKTTQIVYRLKERDTNGHIIIRNSQGKEVLRYANLQEGENIINISGDNLPEGIYYYTFIQNGEIKEQRTMLVNK